MCEVGLPCFFAIPAVGTAAIVELLFLMFYRNILLFLFFFLCSFGEVVENFLFLAIVIDTKEISWIAFHFILPKGSNLNLIGIFPCSFLIDILVLLQLNANGLRLSSDANSLALLVVEAGLVSVFVEKCFFCLLIVVLVGVEELLSLRLRFAVLKTILMIFWGFLWFEVSVLEAREVG
jgi:hypothetical protein